MSEFAGQIEKQELGQKKTAKQLYEKIIELYPDTNEAREAKKQIDLLNSYDTSLAEKVNF